MVKGVSRQVIMVQSPDPKLFDQAIFILKENAVGQGVTDDDLLKEAQKLIRSGKPGKKYMHVLHGALYTGAGALITGLIWILTVLL